jgi:hypothetical protein
MTRQDIQDNYPDSELLLLEEKYFDAAIIGVASRVNTPWAVCYDANKCIELLAKHEGMTLDEADEYFHYNTAGAYVGEHTPAFVYI